MLCGASRPLRAFLPTSVQVGRPDGMLAWEEGGTSMWPVGHIQGSVSRLHGPNSACEASPALCLLVRNHS